MSPATSRARTGHRFRTARLVAPAAALAGCAAPATMHPFQPTHVAPPAPANTVADTHAAALEREPPANDTDPSLRGRLELGADVHLVATRCDAHGAELCNGVDDNCDGTIDEGCGYRSGAVQLTAAWSTRADVDLYVVDPSGEEIYYNHAVSRSGGRLDHDANAGCTDTQPTVENVFWSSPNPPGGTYRARVRAWSLCGGGATAVTLSIAVGGRVVGTVVHTLAVQGESFEVPIAIE